MQKLSVILSEDYFIGKGLHKKTFLYPQKSSCCIKIPYGVGGAKDLQREIKYRAIREEKHLGSTILPKYYGVVDTNMGKGYVFELVEDFDGLKCKTLEDYLNNEDDFRNNFDDLIPVMLKFKEAMFEERIITMGLFPENIIIQRESALSKRIMLVNDMGSAAIIPVAYYFDFFAKKKIAKRWNEFLQVLNRLYPYEAMIKFIDYLR